jgi:hypothetical protein
MAVAIRTGNALYFAAAGDVDTRNLIVTGFTWTGMSDAAHTMTFKDGAGAVWMGPFSTNASLNPVVVTFSKPIKVSGLEVDVLGSGVVNVFLA